MTGAAIHLSDLSWPEAASLAAGGALLVLPVGSTEQHGPHLPLSTDTIIAGALADSLARSRPDVVVAPALPYGSSGEHAGFAGTVSIGGEALERALLEWGRAATGAFGRLVFVNGHGGNAGALRAAAARLQAESRPVLAWSPRWQGDAHAGEIETSLLLAIRPSLVRTDRAVVGNTRPLGTLMPDLRAGRLRLLSPNGVLGDPTRATAERGRLLLAELGADLLHAVDAWAPPAGPR